MKRIVSGKTEGQHRSEEQARRAAQRPGIPPKSRPARVMSKREVEEAKQALHELEETRGDWSKGH
jgi:hypothetical protein